MTRLSICDVTANAMRAGKFALIRPGHHVDRWALRGEHQVHARRAGHLRDAADVAFDVLGRGQHQVGQLVNDDDDVGQGLFPARPELLVVGLDIPRASLANSL